MKKSAKTSKKSKKRAPARSKTKGKSRAQSSKPVSAAKLGAKDFFFEGENGSKKSSSIGVDILSALKQDHDQLREFIEILKDEDATLTQKKSAFEAFRSLLLSHSKSEEESVYRPCKEIEDLKELSFEGFEEHAVADELMKKVAATEDSDQWKARAKVLAELVEHHIEEEEEEFFPEIEKRVSGDEREEMSENFIHLRERSQPSRTAKNAGVLAN